MTTGERISKLRESRNVFQKDLAKAIKIDPVVMNRIEKGKRSTRDEELRRIADFFDVTTDYLLGRETVSPPLSKTQSTLLKVFDDLNDDGQNAVLFMLGSLEKSHAKQKSKTANVVQKNLGGINNLAVNGNIYSK